MTTAHPVAIVLLGLFDVGIWLRVIQLAVSL